MHFISLLFFSLIVYSALSAPPQQYKPILTINLTDNLEKLTYSHNQKLLVGFKTQAQGQFLVFDGLKLNNMKTLSVNDQNKERVSPSIFAFSRNDDLLILGSKQGGVYGFKIANNIISSQYDYSFVVGSKTQQNWIKAISFSTQNKIAISAKTSLIVLDTSQGKFVQIQKYDFTYTIYALAWSVLEPKVLIVGTLSSSQGEFSLYNSQKNSTLSINKDKTESIAIFPDGKTILKGAVGKNVQVFTYQIGAAPVLADTIMDTNDTKEIFVSQNGLYFALKANSGQIKAFYVQTNAQFNLKNQQSSQIFKQFLPGLNQTGKSFSLTSNGGDILIIPTDGSAQINKFSLCQNKTFFNKQELQCSVCSQNCNNCFNLDICTTCNPDKFISDQYTCELCGSKLNGCVTCSSSQTCITCNQNKNWNIEAKNGKCECKDTFYDDNGQCSTCGVFTDCLNCIGPNKCTLCKDQGHFNTQPQYGLCICKQSFWLNQTQCNQCSQSISDCQLCSQDGTKCTQCQSPDRKPNIQQSQCVCVDYKYEDQQTKKCEFCDVLQNCITCQTAQPHKCLKCDTQKHFKQDAKDGECLCANSYFKNSEGGCTLCSDVLLDCQICDTKDICLLCKDQNHFDVQPKQNKCVCIENWILVDQQCKLCSQQINGCSVCSSNKICTTCDDNKHFNKTPSDGQCKCMDQYWLNDKTCQLCSQKIIGCSTCSQDGSRCLTCQDQNRQPAKDGLSCQCKPFTYQNPESKTCQPCDEKHSCVQCKTDTNHECKQCDVNGHWNSTPIAGKCQCMDNYNQYDNKCIFCMVPGCTICPSQTECQQCSQDKKFQKIAVQNKCECKTGTRLSDNKQQCIDCNVTIIGCKQCSNAKNCQLCDTENHWTIDSTNDICLCQKGWYLQNTQCESCSKAIDNCLYCSVFNGGSIECNQCEKGYGKTSNNKSCISCHSASPGCVNCDESNKCTVCDQQNGFILNGTKCICTKGYFIKGEECTLCSTAISGCKQCDEQNVCNACNPDDMFVPQPNAEHKCDCITEWTLYQGQCTKCSIITGCLTCSDINTCTKCNQEANFELTTDDKCQCTKGYWINEASCHLCDEKIPNCLICSQNGQQCTQCADSNRTLNDKKDKCICQQFMFQNTQKQCEFCDANKNCKQCTNKDYCTVCDTNKKWIEQAVQGKCLCENGYQQWNNQCLLCQVNGCIQCHEQNYCFQCSNTKKFNTQPIDGKCQCQPNTHLNGDQCFQCQQKLIGCQQCDNLQKCTVCNDKNYFILNNQTKLCQCDSNHYFISPDCVACSRAINYCSECKVNDDTKQCIKCQKGYTIDTNNKTNCLNCQDLIIGCFACSDDKTCTQCNEKGNFQPLQNQCACKKGFFLQSPQCVQCSLPIPGCKNCDKNGEKCTQCDEEHSFKLNDQLGRCQCLQGFYLNDHQCDQCSSILEGCSDCQQDGSKCLSCKDEFYLAEGECLQCQKKIAGCTKCSVNDQQLQCSQCNMEHFIFNEKTKICDCIETYFLKQLQCELCSSELISCKKCSMDGKQCQQCEGEHFILNNDKKLCQCQQSYYIHDNSTCQLCTEAITGCSKCNQQGSQCNECNKSQNFILNDTRCRCIDGYFLSNLQNLCNLCSTINPGCTKCSPDGKQSLQCNMTNFVLNKQEKKCQCIDGYFIASNTQCKLCSQSIDYCQTCTRSNTNTIQITDFSPKCLECQNTFILNNEGTSCVCEGDNKQIINGLCKNKQASINWILYGAIAGGALLVIAIGILVYRKIKKAKLVRLDSYNELDDEQNNSKSAKPQTILTDGSNDKLVFKSSVYRLEDQE